MQTNDYAKDFVRRNYSHLIKTAGERTQEASDQGIIGDSIDAFQMGAGQGVAGIFDFFGANDVAAGINDWANSQLDQMSTEGQEALSKDFFGENAGGLDKWWLTAMQGLGNVAPTLIPGAGVAGGLMRLGSAATKGMKVSNALSKTGKTAAGMAGYGAVGGSAATGQAEMEAKEVVRNIPLDDMKESPLFQEKLRQIAKESPDLPPDQALEAARQLMVEQAEEDVKTDPLLLATNFASSAIFDPIIGRFAGRFAGEKIINKIQGKNIATKPAALAARTALRASKGAVAEGTQEALQGDVENQALRGSAERMFERDLPQSVDYALGQGKTRGERAAENFAAGAVTGGLLTGFPSKQPPEINLDQENQPDTNKPISDNPELNNAAENLDNSLNQAKQNIDGKVQAMGFEQARRDDQQRQESRAAIEREVVRRANDDFRTDDGGYQDTLGRPITREQAIELARADVQLEIDQRRDDVPAKTRREQAGPERQRPSSFTDNTNDERSRADRINAELDKNYARVERDGQEFYVAPGENPERGGRLLTREEAFVEIASRNATEENRDSRTAYERARGLGPEASRDAIDAYDDEMTDRILEQYDRNYENRTREGEVVGPEGGLARTSDSTEVGPARRPRGRNVEAERGELPAPERSRLGTDQRPRQQWDEMVERTEQRALTDEGAEQGATIMPDRSPREGRLELGSSGLPYGSEKSLRRSKKYRDLAKDNDVEIVPVDGGFGMRVYPKAEQSTAVEPDTQPTPELPRPTSQDAELDEDQLASVEFDESNPEHRKYRGKLRSQATRRKKQLDQVLDNFADVKDSAAYKELEQMREMLDRARNGDDGALFAMPGDGDIGLAIRQREQQLLRDSANADPEVAKQNYRFQSNQTEKAYNPQEGEIDVRYVIRDLDTLVPSNTDDFNLNPDYDQALQPRDRTTTEAQQDIIQKANQFAPSRVLEGSTTDAGAPIVNPETNMVESGNGRTLIMRRALRDPQVREQYIQELRRQAEARGIPQSTIDRGLEIGATPVLVRERVTPMDSRQVRDFVNQANQPTAERMNDGQQAQADASRLTDDNLRRLTQAAGQAEQVRAFVQALGLRGEGLLDRNGVPTQSAVDRVQNALFAKAYNSQKMTDAAANANTDDSRNVLASLRDIAPQVALLRSSNTAQAREFSDALSEAALLVTQSRNTNQSVDEMISQQGLFGDVSDAAGKLAKLMDRNIRSRQRMIDELSGIANSIQSSLGDGATDSMFDLPSLGAIIDQQIVDSNRGSGEQTELGVAGSGQRGLGGDTSQPVRDVSDDATGNRVQVESEPALSPDTSGETGGRVSTDAEPQGPASTETQGTTGVGDGDSARQGLNSQSTARLNPEEYTLDEYLEKALDNSKYRQDYLEDPELLESRRKIWRKEWKEGVEEAAKNRPLSVATLDSYYNTYGLEAFQSAFRGQAERGVPAYYDFPQFRLWDKTYDQVRQGFADGTLSGGTTRPRNMKQMHREAVQKAFDQGAPVPSRIQEYYGLGEQDTGADQGLNSQSTDSGLVRDIAGYAADIREALASGQQSLAADLRRNLRAALERRLDGVDLTPYRAQLQKLDKALSNGGGLAGIFGRRSNLGQRFDSVINEPSADTRAPTVQNAMVAMDRARKKLNEAFQSGRISERVYRDLTQSIVEGTDAILDRDYAGGISYADRIDQQLSEQGLDDSDTDFVKSDIGPQPESKPSNPVSRNSLDSFVRGWLNRYGGAAGVQVDVVDSPADLPDLRLSASDTLQGGYIPSQNRVVLFANNLPDLKTAKEVLRHEILAHHGIRKVVSPSQGNELIKRIINTRDRGRGAVKDAWETVERRYPGESVEVQAEEVFALLSESEPGKLGDAWSRVVAYVKQTLRDLGLLDKDQVSKEELQQVIRSIAQGFRNRGVSPDGGPGGGQQADVLASRTDTPGMLFSKSEAYYGDASRGDMDGMAEAQRQEQMRQTQTSQAVKRALEQGRSWWESTKALGNKLMTLRQFAEVTEKIQPLVKKYADVVQRMLTDRETMAGQAGEVADNVHSWAKKNRKAAENLFELMNLSTLWGEYPGNTGPEDADPAVINKRLHGARNHARKLLREEKASQNPDDIAIEQLEARIADLSSRIETDQAQRRARRDKLNKMWRDLPQEGKDHYIKMRDILSAHDDKYRQIMIDRIERSQLDDKRKQRMIDHVRLEQEASRLAGPYFPLQRFGEFYIEYREDVVDADGSTTNERVVVSVESKAEADRVYEQLRQNKSVTEVTKPRKRTDKDYKEDGASFSFLEDLFKDLQSKSDQGQLSDQQQEQLVTSIYQTYLQHLPARSFRKNRVRRKGVRGYDRDALRAFSSVAMKNSYQLSRLEHVEEMNEVLKQMERDANEDETGNTQLADIYNEMKKRHTWVVNPSNSKVARGLTALGFTYMLGVSPVAAMVNLTQTFNVGIPVIKSRTNQSWLSVSTDIASLGKNFLRSSLANKDPGFHDTDEFLSKEEKDVIKQLKKTGVLDKSNTHNLLGLADAGVEQEFNDGTRRALNAVGYLFHNAEVMNREVTALAAYRAFRKDGMDHNSAIKAAGDAVWESHFDYTNANRAPFMQGDVLKVLTQFRQYSQQMSYYLARNFYRALKLGKTTKAEQKEAATQLLGTLSITGAIGGVSALPVTWVAYGMADALQGMFGDDDEPFDAETEVRKWLSENLGKEVADYVVYGAGGASVSQRIGISDLWYREPFRDLETGQDIWTHLAMQVTGPTLGGIGAQVLNGATLMQEGEYYRGLEKMVPKFVRDPMVAGRYYFEGATNIRGDAIKPMEEFRGLDGWTSLFLQANGLADTDVIRQYEENNSIKGYEKQILDRRRSLLTRFYQSVIEQDAKDRDEVTRAIYDFNRANPRKPIRPADLKRSMKQRMRYSQENRRGINVDRDLRYLAEENDWARD